VTTDSQDSRFVEFLWLYFLEALENYEGSRQELAAIRGRLAAVEAVIKALEGRS